jgi:hypothetical protein
MITALIAIHSAGFAYPVNILMIPLMAVPDMKRWIAPQNSNWILLNTEAKIAPLIPSGGGH